MWVYKPEIIGKEDDAGHRPYNQPWLPAYAIHLLRTEKQITALNAEAYLFFLALAIEIQSKNPTKPIAKVVKGY